MVLTIHNQVNKMRLQNNNHNTTLLISVWKMSMYAQKNNWKVPNVPKCYKFNSDYVLKMGSCFSFLFSSLHFLSYFIYILYLYVVIAYCFQNMKTIKFWNKKKWDVLNLQKRSLSLQDDFFIKEDFPLWKTLFLLRSFPVTTIKQ